MGNQTYWGPFRRGREGYSNMTTEVVVLMGGRSSEREVSIMSGVAVSESPVSYTHLTLPTMRIV